MRIVRLPLLVLVLTMAACGSTSSGPRGVLDQYSRALGDGEYAKAYAMMSAKFRAQHTQEDFVRLMKSHKREVRETTARLGADHRELTVSAEFGYGLGSTMRLVREDGQWRIVTNPVPFYTQGTPRETLRSFVRAYRLKKWTIMLGFVPDDYRKRMNEAKMQEQFEGAYREENANMMNILEANIEEPIQEKGDEARMAYGDRYEVKFRRESGSWKIQDLDSSGSL